MRTAAYAFSPADEHLKLGVEGYSPALLAKIVRQGGKAPSFSEASADLQALAEFEISPKHVERLTERVGREWAATRDKEVELFKQDRLFRHYGQTPGTVAVMLDGGRLQTRADAGRSGVHQAAWCEPKYACCLSLQSQISLLDPQPKPPSKLLDPERVRRLVQELREVHAPRAQRTATVCSARRKRKRRRPRRTQVLVRTAVATLAGVEDFGYQVATEVFRRNFDTAEYKACVCDGQHYNWAVWKTHLQPLGFVPILDFLHMLSYLYAAAHASVKAPLPAWQKYERWLRATWAGDVDTVLQELERDVQRLGPPPDTVADNEPRAIVFDARRYLQNNRERMNYPRYRRLGLPISSAPVESLIKQFNRRVKGSEKFWLHGGAEAVLQVRAAYLSQDDRADRFWNSPRPRLRAAGAHRLAS